MDLARVELDVALGADQAHTEKRPHRRIAEVTVWTVRPQPGRWDRRVVDAHAEPLPVAVPRCVTVHSE